MSRFISSRLLQRSLHLIAASSLLAWRQCVPRKPKPRLVTIQIRSDFLNAGQAAHARGEFDRALELYEEALKVRPEFPEAEFQKGTALLSLNRLPEAEPAFRRAIELRKNWSLPYSALGVLLTRLNRDAEAVPFLEQALQLDKNDTLALRVLASLRLRAGNSAEALRLAQSATSSN